MSNKVFGLIVAASILLGVALPICVFHRQIFHRPGPVPADASQAADPSSDIFPAGSDAGTGGQDGAEGTGEASPENTGLVFSFGNVIADDQSIYYWRYNGDSFSHEPATFAYYNYSASATNELVRRDADGTETVTLRTCGAGELALANGRIYYQEYTEDSLYGNCRIMSCLPDGSDSRYLGEGKLKGITDRGQYVIAVRQSTGGAEIVSIHTADEAIITVTDNRFLICSDSEVICTKETGDSDAGASGRAITVCAIRGDGSGERELYTNRAGELLETLRDPEGTGGGFGGVEINSPYILENTLYYVFAHVDGTAHITQSCAVLKIDLGTGATVVLDSQLEWDSGKIRMLSGDSADLLYADYINDFYHGNVLEPSDYAGFSTLEQNTGSVEEGSLRVYYYNRIGAKEYVLLTYGDFISWMGWRDQYQFVKCALYEKDSNTGAAVLLFDSSDF